MNSEEKIQFLRAVFEQFLTRVKDLESMHQAEIKKILGEISERKLNEMRERLGS